MGEIQQPRNKNDPPFSGIKSRLKRIRDYETGEEGAGSRHSFAR